MSEIVTSNHTGNKSGPYYRSRVEKSSEFSLHIVYKFSDILIKSDKDIKNRTEEPLKEIYSQLEFCIKKDPQFLKSLSPLRVKTYYPEAVKKMCALSARFNVGPMAAVAGTVNDYIAESLSGFCDYLVIENGGDVYARSAQDLKIGIFIKDMAFAEKIVLKIGSRDMPCGICSSSATFGHSLSLGRCDLAVMISKSSITADAAATAAANSIIYEDDIAISLDYFSRFKDILGMLLIKGKRIGMWGKMQLVNNQ